MTLGVVAQLIPRKGHRYLLEVLPELLVAYPNLHLLIFGQGPLEPELTRAVQHPDFDGRVQMVGFRNDLRRVMPNLYAVIHPAEKEGLGVALLQASACSVPVVAARAGGIPEIVRHDENGLTFDVGDVGALKQHLAHLLSDRGLRDRLGGEGRRLATSAFSIDAMVEGNLAVYNSLLEV
jgi:glycosyltransferase involved in cell wall biosynthesis